GVDVIHLHHAVWLNLSAQDTTVPALPERFFAVGEEKTILKFPAGYGYKYKTTDHWLLNYMLHNLTPDRAQVWIAYDIDFIPPTPTPDRTDTRHLFPSVSHYYDPAGPVSWHVTMAGTPEDWRVQVHKGYKLSVTATYESKVASWYEGMGIMVVWMAAGHAGA